MSLKKLFGAALLLCISTASFAQKIDTARKSSIKYFSKELAVPDSTAAKVLVVLTNHKAAIRTVLEQTADQEKQRKKIDSLVMIKNAQLSTLLTTEQLEKVAPASERKKRN